MCWLKRPPLYLKGLKFSQTCSTNSFIISWWRIIESCSCCKLFSTESFTLSIPILRSRFSLKWKLTEIVFSVDMKMKIRCFYNWAIKQSFDWLFYDIIYIRLITTNISLNHSIVLNILILFQCFWKGFLLTCTWSKP